MSFAASYGKSYDGNWSSDEADEEEEDASFLLVLVIPFENEEDANRRVLARRAVDRRGRGMLKEFTCLSSFAMPTMAQSAGNENLSIMSNILDDIQYLPSGFLCIFPYFSSTGEKKRRYGDISNNWQYQCWSNSDEDGPSFFFGAMKKCWCTSTYLWMVDGSLRE